MYKIWTITVFAAALAAGGCTKKADNSNESTAPRKDEGSKKSASSSQADGDRGDEGGKSKSKIKDGPGARETPRGAEGATGEAAKKEGPRLVEIWSSGGLKVPESVLYDNARKVLYVSCINGKPTEKNGKGFTQLVQKDRSDPGSSPCPRRR